jgi:hypothetical protein
MKQINIIICLLLLLIIILFIAIYYFNNIIKKANKIKKTNEYYRYQLSLLNKAEQAARLVEKVKKGIELYNKVKNMIPKIKKMFEIMTDWNKLKSKMCLWASNKQLLSGLVAVINKAIKSSKIKPYVRTILEKVKRILIKIQVYQSIAVGAQNILDLLPGIPNEIKSGVDLFVKIDSNLVELFSKAGLNLGC